MKALIELNYLLQDGRDKEWSVEKKERLNVTGLSEKVVQKFANLFNLVIPNFSPCLFDKDAQWFLFRSRMTILDISYIDEWDYLFKLIEAICKDIEAKVFEAPFRIKEIVREVAYPSNAKALARKLAARMNSTLGISTDPPTFVDPTDHARMMALNDPPPCYEIIVVEHPMSSKGHNAFSDAIKPLKFESPYPEDIPVDIRISSPRDDEMTGFSGFIIYLFAKYLFLVGSYDRIKLCQFCSRIFHETKIGYRKFCSNKCRKAQSDSLDPEEKRLCRGRQNHWIKHQFDNSKALADKKIANYATLQKSHCASCIEIGPKSGACPTLIKRNRDLLEAIRK